MSSYGLSNNSLLKELDQQLKIRKEYMIIKENRIDSIRNSYAERISLPDQYNLNRVLFKEYATYNFDSAMTYVMKNKEISSILNDKTHINNTKLDYGELLSTSGLIKESIDIIESINRSEIKEESDLLKYYETLAWIYRRASTYANDTVFAPKYFHKGMSYIDSLYMKLPENSIESNYYKGYIYMQEKKLKEAEVLLLDVYNKTNVETRLYAIVTFYLSTIYSQKNDEKRHEEFLIKSAISDQMCALKENLSLQTLALYLFQNKPEELDRAYRYIQISMQDARFFKNRIRAIQIGDKLPIIVSAYQAKNDMKTQQLKILLIVISILSFLMLLSMAYIFRQMKLLNKKKRKLQMLNAQLKELNKHLQDANKTKEEYVSLFIDLCSSYIDQINNYKTTVVHKIMANRVNDLLKQAKSTGSTDSLLTDFFQNFDKAFLNLYPTFIKDLNALLQDEHQIELKEGQLLDTELRIFALIRLGITDSSKIASFLRYSPQTIYNYRSKMRNKVKIDRDNFEKRVMTIGL